MAGRADAGRRWSLAPFLAGLFGLLFGWFCVRLSGVYFAMLTLAFAQIAWSVAFQWVEVTGGDNGILGVWPDAWATPKLVYYYLTLALCLGAIAVPAAGHPRALRLCAAGAAGQRLACRGDRHRCLPHPLAGLRPRRRRRRASPAGCSPICKGSVFPDLHGHPPQSVDALLMVLLGGVQTLSGPIVGALAFTGLQEQLVRLTDLWRLVLGSVIVVLVLFFPQGSGRCGARSLRRRRHGDT